MQYLLTFTEGVITIISPCILPLLPLYVAYFAADGVGGSRRVLTNASGFVIGFTAIFVALGIFAGTVGGFFILHQNMINIVTGSIVILMGLAFLGVFRLPSLGGKFSFHIKYLSNLTFMSAILFGIVFAVAHTPCLGAFLGSALMKAASTGSRTEGAFLLFLYSMGLGIPLIASALFIDKLKDTFSFLRKHRRTVTFIGGGFLILMGLSMIFGLLH